MSTNVARRRNVARKAGREAYEAGMRETEARTWAEKLAACRDGNVEARAFMLGWLESAFAATADWK